MSDVIKKREMSMRTGKRIKREKEEDAKMIKEEEAEKEEGKTEEGREFTLNTRILEK